MASQSKLISSGLIGLAVIVIAVVIVVVATGGDDSDTAAPTGKAAAGADPQAVQLFAGTCGQCHTLTVAGSHGTVGPDLDDNTFTRERVLHAIQNGAGNGAMAPGLLEGADAERVAALIANDEPLLSPNVQEGEHK